MLVLLKGSIPRFIAMAAAIASLGFARPGDAGPLKLVPVTPIADSPRPGWIVEVSPDGDARGDEQIRAVFQHDLVAFASLEAPDNAEVLRHFSIAPQIAGHFRLASLRVVEFVPDAPIPDATRVRMAIRRGLRDSVGNVLASDFHWTFATKPLQIGISTYEINIPERALIPRFRIHTSVPVDPKALFDRSRLSSTMAPQESIGLVVVDPTADEKKYDAYDGGSPDGTILYVVPRRPLQRDTAYVLEVSAGLDPLLGNVATTERTVAGYRTYGDFVCKLAIDSGYYRFKGNVHIRCTNPVDPKTLADGVRVVLRGKTIAVRTSFQYGAIDFDENALAPKTTYDVFVTPALRDIYGQTIEHPYHATFTNPAFAPRFSATSGVFRVLGDAPLSFSLEATALEFPTIYEIALPITPHDLQMYDFREARDAEAILPSRDLWGQTEIPPGRDVVRVNLDGDRFLHGHYGLVAYGVAARLYGPVVGDENGEDRFPVAYGVFGRTNLGIDALLFPRGGYVRVTHVSDLTPVASSPVELYRSYYPYPPVKGLPTAPCATGTTGPDGVLALSMADLAPCVRLSKMPQSPKFLIIAREGSDFTYTRSSPIDIDLFEGDSRWFSGFPIPRGHLFGDRIPYRRGEIAHIAALAFFERDGTLERARSKRFFVAALTERGRRVSLGSANVDAFGLFHLDYRIPKEAELGRWRLSARGDFGETLDGTMIVAHVRPPTFSSHASVSNEVIRTGDLERVDVRAAYLSGEPLRHGRVAAHIWRAETTSPFSPRWERYTFGFEREDYANTDPPPIDLVERIDDRGLARFNIRGAALFAPTYYGMDIYVLDPAARTMRTSVSFAVLPARLMAGVTLTISNTAILNDASASVVIVDGTGSPVANEPFRWSLRNSAGIVAAGRDLSTYSPRRITLPKLAEGWYRFAAIPERTSRGIGSTYRASSPPNADEERSPLALGDERRTTRVGDTFRDTIFSPFDRAQLDVRVLRQGESFHERSIVHRGSTRFRFTVTRTMAPEALVQVVLRRLGRGARNDDLTKAYVRSAHTIIHVIDPASALSLGVRARVPSVRPGGYQQLDFVLHDTRGRPIPGELAVAVVDRALLNASGYDFGKEALGNIQARAEPAVWGQSISDDAPSRGYEAMMAVRGLNPNVRVRTNFSPTALFTTRIRIGRDGHATARFTLPDTLTTWDVAAIAVTRDRRFAAARSQFVVTKLLAVSPLVPAFVRPGDVFYGGVQVPTVADRARVDASVSDGLRFLASGPRRVSERGGVPNASGERRFAMVAGGTDTSTITFATRAGSLRDTMRITLPIVGYDSFEQVALLGATRKFADVPIGLSGFDARSLPHADVTLSSSLAGPLAAEATILDAPPIPSTPSLASHLRIAASFVMLWNHDEHRRDRERVRAMAKDDVAALLDAQRDDGGFAMWPTDASSTFEASLDATFALERARRAGLSVGMSLMRLRQFWEASLVRKDCENILAACHHGNYEVTLAFDALGVPIPQSLLTGLDDEVDALQVDARVVVAALFLRVGRFTAHAKKIEHDLRSLRRFGSRYETADDDLPRNASGARIRAALLEFARASGAPPDDIDRLATSLLGDNIRGHFGSDSDDAIVLATLIDVALAERREAARTATIRFGTHGSTYSLVGESAPSAAFSLQSRAFGSARETHIGIRAVGGTVHYAVTMRYRIPLLSLAVANGLGAARIVRDLGSGRTIRSAEPIRVEDGTALVVEERVFTDHPLNNVVIDDPLPAGAEVVDTDELPDRFNDARLPTYRAFERTRVLAYMDELPAGTTVFRYLIRATTPGRFRWPPLRAYVESRPEEFGRSSATEFAVSEP